MRWLLAGKSNITSKALILFLFSSTLSFMLSIFAREIIYLLVIFGAFDLISFAAHSSRQLSHVNLDFILHLPVKVVMIRK